MALYSVALFVHVLGALGLFAGLAPTLPLGDQDQRREGAHDPTPSA